MTYVNRQYHNGADVPSSRKTSTSSSNSHELLGKRHGEEDPEAPRAKRRLEKINAQFERFSISEDSDRNGKFTMDTSDSEDEAVFGGQNDGVIIEEENDTSNGLLLGDYLKGYLRRMKQDNFGLPTRSTIQGNELVIWRPIAEVRDPFEDPSMEGRIQEVESGENFADEVCNPHIVTESGDSESETEMSSQASLRQTPHLRIEDITEQSNEDETMECD